MGRLIKYIVIFLALIVAFMYFFGKGEDKTQARTIVHESGEVVKAIGDFLKRQKDKYDDGEFDHLIEGVNETIRTIKSKISNSDEMDKDQLKKMLDELEKLDPSKLSPENREKLAKTKKELKNLLESKD